MTRRAPRVSLITPAYNSGEFISETLDSILSQTLDDFEAIVVDDGSTDDTPEVVEAYARRDPRVVLIRESHVGRPSRARNVGMRRARGTFVAFVDSDDLLCPTKLERQLAAFAAAPDAGLSFHDFQIFPGPGSFNGGPTTGYLECIGYLEDMREVFERIAQRTYVASTSFAAYMGATAGHIGVFTGAAMLRRELISRRGLYFREDLIIAEDMDLWWRAARTTRTVYLDEPLVFYRERPGSLMHSRMTASAVRDEYIVQSAILRHAQLDLPPRPERKFPAAVAKRWWELGYHCLEADLRVEARGCFVRSLMLSRDWLSILGLIRSFVPGVINRGYRFIRPSLLRERNEGSHGS